ncbi:MAG: ROK family protein [Firmicutes bacterium]|nr:ROK family protein [Bacillota bacterium]
MQTRGERAVFRCIRRTPGISRVELCERTELTSAAVTQIVKRFMAAGLVREIPAKNAIAGNIGRTRIGLAPVDSAYFSLGIVVRRHDIQMGLVAPSGKVAHAWRMVAPTIERVASTLEDVVEAAGEIPIVAVGVGLPTFAVPWATASDITATIANRFDCPVYSFHNGSYAALAEEWFMEEEVPSRFFYVFIGSGIGGASVLRAGNEPPVITCIEAGHVGIDPHGERCFCGNRGCVELMASPASLEAHYHINIDLGIEGVKGLSERTKEAVGESLAYGLVSITNVLNIHYVVLGGYPPEVLDYLYGNTLRKTLAGYRNPFGHPLTIVTSRLGDLAGVQGAALGAQDQIGTVVDRNAVLSYR